MNENEKMFDSLSVEIAENLIDSIPDIIFIIDKEYRIQRILNNDLTKFFIPVEDIIGTRIDSLLKYNSLEIVKEAVGRAFESGDLQLVEYSIGLGDSMQYFEGRLKRLNENLVACFERNVTEQKKTMEELKEATRQLNMAFHVNSAVPLLWDIRADIIKIRLDGEFKDSHANIKGKRKGVPVSEAVLYIHPADRDGTLMALEEIRQGRMDTNNCIIRYDIDQDKFEQYFEVYFTVEKRDEEGKPVRAIGSIRDVTKTVLHEQEIIDAKRELESAQNMNQLILDHTNIGLAYIDKNYMVQWENISKKKDYASVFKYKPGMFCYYGLNNQTTICEDCVAEKAFLTQRVETNILRISDDFAVEVTASPVIGDAGVLSGVVLKYEDITMQEKAADELRRAKEAAESSDKLKSVFLSNMSHEIRTPLNAIVGFSDLLAYEDDQEARNEYISIIKRNNDLLLQLINDILDLSKIESNTLEFIYQYFDINELFGRLKANLLGREISGNVKLIFEEEFDNCIIYSEETRIYQVMQNFLNNALKFTNEGEIRVGYKLLEEGIRFYVSDTGMGIPEDKQNEVFDRFAKLNDFVNGTGLGLSICRTIVNKLEGEIGVDSKSGEGSTFWFILPVKPTATYDA